MYRAPGKCLYMVSRNLISSCSCLIVLPGPAWVLLSKKYMLFPGALYILYCGGRLRAVASWPRVRVHGTFTPNMGFAFILLNFALRSKFVQVLMQV